MPSATSSIAQAITEGFKLLKSVLDTAEVRKMRKAIDAAEKYIQTNEREGQFKEISDEQREKYLRLFSKRFFGNN